MTSRPRGIGQDGILPFDDDLDESHEPSEPIARDALELFRIFIAINDPMMRKELIERARQMRDS